MKILNSFCVMETVNSPHSYHVSSPSSVLTALVLLLVMFLADFGMGAPWTENNQAWNVNFNPAHQPQEYYGIAPNLTSNAAGHYRYYESPKDWRQESIYQIVTDRFSDGNPENNEGSHFGFDGYDLRYVNSRHGGDFVGLKNKLHYIKSLGYSTIWISPVFQNMENSYHSYAQIDFTLLDDRFGTLEEFREMVQAAHSIGLRIIVDIVVNHMADLYHFDGHVGAPDVPFHMHGEEYKMYAHDERRQYFDFTVSNQFDTDGHYCPIYDDRGQRIEDQKNQGSYWFSDFHHNGDLRDAGYGNPWNNHLGKIYGIMDDLRTSHPRVAKKIIAMTKALITSADIDGIRVDTPMQVPLQFFQDWAPAIRKHAKALGKKNFAIFGEFYCTRERAATMTGRGISKKFVTNQFGEEEISSRDFIGDETQVTMDGGIHYPLYYWFMDTVKSQKHDIAGLMKLYEQDKADYDFWNPISNWQWQYRHLHFYNNHDQWRMSTEPVDGLKKTDLSSAIIAFWPGIPLFYYGDEQGFNTPGTALDGWAREDFMTSLAWRHPQDSCGARPVNPATGDSFSQTDAHFLHIQKVMNVRRLYSALNQCDDVYERWHQQDFKNGLYAYTRACGANESEYALIIFNTWKDQLKIPENQMYSGWQSSGTILNVLGEYQFDGKLNFMKPTEKITLNNNGFVNSEIILNGYEIKVFIREDGLRALDPSVLSISPAHDEVINKLESQLVVELHFNQPMQALTVIKALQMNGKHIYNLKHEYNEKERRVILKIPANQIQEGVNVLSIEEYAKSKDGKRSLYGRFESRFRVGRIVDNVVLNGCLNFKEQPSLISKAAFYPFYKSTAAIVRQPENSNDLVQLAVKCMKDGGFIGKTGWANSPFHYLQSNPIRLRMTHTASGAKKIRVRLGRVNAATSFPGKLNPSDELQRYSIDWKSLNAPAHRTMSVAPKSLSAKYHYNLTVTEEPAIMSLDGPWSDWIEYSNETEHELYAQWRVNDDFCNYRVGKMVDIGSVRSGFNWRDIVATVQYWVDGSASYIVHGYYRIQN